MKNKIVKFGSFLGLALVGVSVSTSSYVANAAKVNAVPIGNQAAGLKTTANDDYTVLWDNDNRNKLVFWSTYYLFGLDDGSGQKDCLAVIPENIWNDVIKHGTFYLDLEATNPRIRVVTGWWSEQWPNGADKDITPSDSQGTTLVDNEDGTFTLTLNFDEYPILDHIDERHLLFTGSDYTPIRLYYGNKPDMTGKHYIDVHKRDTAKYKNHAYLTPEKLIASTGDFVTVTMSYLDEGDSFEYAPKVKQYSGSEVTTTISGDTFTFTMPDADVYVTADFKDDDFVVSFNVGDEHGTPIEPQRPIAFGGTAKPEYQDDDSGYFIHHWCSDANKEIEWNFNTNTIECDTTLYAYWEQTFSIRMENNPTKLEYDIGEDLDLTNVTIKVGYLSGEMVGETSRNVTTKMIRNYNKYKSGEQLVSIMYGGISKPAFSVTVADFDVSLKTKPDKVEYVVGEDLDLTGATLTLTSKGGTGKTVDIDVTPDMVSGYDKAKASTQTITVTLDGKTATFDVTVVDSVTSISIKSTPTKTTYVVGEELDLTGAKLERVLKSGKVEEIDVTSTMVSGYDKTKIGTQTLTVTLDGKTATFTVTVSDPVPTPTSGGGISTGALVGAIIGSVVGGAAIALGITFLILKKKQKPASK